MSTAEDGFTDYCSVLLQYHDKIKATRSVCTALDDLCRLFTSVEQCWAREEIQAEVTVARVVLKKAEVDLAKVVTLVESVLLGQLARPNRSLRKWDAKNQIETAFKALDKMGRVVLFKKRVLEKLQRAVIDFAGLKVETWTEEEHAELLKLE